MASPARSSYEQDEELLLGGEHLTVDDVQPRQQTSRRASSRGVVLLVAGLLAAAAIVALLRQGTSLAVDPASALERPEMKVEVPSLKAEAKAEVKMPETKAEAKAEATPEAKTPEAKAEATPEAKPAAALEAKAEAKEEAKAKAQAPAPKKQAKKRKQLRIEGDLGALITEHNIGKGVTQAPPTASECAQHAKTLFESVTMHSGLDKELDTNEKGAFADRFSGEMDRACQSDPLFIKREKAWLEGAKESLEQQKPVMTKALAHNLNRAGLSWQAKMQDWLVHESKASFEARLGRTALPHDANATEAKSSGRQGGYLPQEFNSAEQWPRCQREIMRIHNQGICGSCWAFSCSQVLNARICIESEEEHKFDGEDAQVAPGYFASCASNRAHPGDGCSGGWEYFCYQYIDRPGTPGAVSESCSPYFGVGSGVNHFKKRSHAPACPSMCREEYPRTLAQDGFKLPGVSSYRLLMPANRHAHHLAKQAIYHGGPINHGIYASAHFMGYAGGVYDHCTGMSANHAVVTYGWFEGGYYSKNSWGEDWGEMGLMRLADCIMTDFTIPGNFDGWNSHIPYPLAEVWED